MLFSPLNALHLPHPLAQNNRRVATQRHKHGLSPASDQGMPISNEARLLFELENGLVTDSCDVVRCAGFSLDANYPPYISFTLCASKRNKRVAQVQYLIHL